MSATRWYRDHRALGLAAREADQAVLEALPHGEVGRVRLLGFDAPGPTWIPPDDFDDLVQSSAISSEDFLLYYDTITAGFMLVLRKQRRVDHASFVTSLLAMVRSGPGAEPGYRPHAGYFASAVRPKPRPPISVYEEWALRSVLGAYGASLVLRSVPLPPQPSRPTGLASYLPADSSPLFDERAAGGRVLLDSLSSHLDSISVPSDDLFLFALPVRHAHRWAVGGFPDEKSPLRERIRGFVRREMLYQSSTLAANATPSESWPFPVSDSWLARLGREVLRALARVPRVASRHDVGLSLICDYGLPVSFDVRLRHLLDFFRTDPSASLHTGLLATLRSFP